MKILLTGSSGQLGSEIKKQLILRNVKFSSLTHQFLQDVSLIDLLKIIDNISAIIYCAANTDVDFCELNTKNCFFDNHLLPMKLFDAANMAGIKIVFISSAGVYGNGKQNSPYLESDEPFPTTNYHKAKLKTESDLLINNPNALIIRLGWLYSSNVSSNKNFIVNRLKEAMRSYHNGMPMFANVDQCGTPCSANNAAIRILKLLDDGNSGLYNCADSGGSVTRFEYVSKIIKAASFPIEVVPASGKAFSRPAPVPQNESILNYRMDKDGYIEMLDWEQGVENCLADILFNNKFVLPK